MTKITSDEIKGYAIEKGADLVGIASIDSFAGYPEGRHPQDLLPDAKSVIVVGVRVLADTVRPNLLLSALHHITLNLYHNQIAYDVGRLLDDHDFKAVVVPHRIGNLDPDLRKSPDYMNIKSAAQVVSELVTLKERHGIEGVWFKDSIFNLDKEWVKEFCRLMIEANTGIQWQSLTRVDLIDEEQIILMKQAGLTQLDLGIETGSPKSLIRLKKGITVERIKEQVAIAKRHVKVFGFFMIGIPGEQELDVKQTFDLAKALELDRWTWSIYSPLPGSALYEDLIAEGKIEPYRLDFNQVHFTEAYEGICDIQPARLKDLYKEINDYFYQLHARSEYHDEFIDDGIYADA